MNETLHEEQRKPFDAILAEDFRLRLDAELGDYKCKTLDDLSIEFAQMAEEWRQELREADVLGKEWD